MEGQYFDYKKNCFAIIRKEVKTPGFPGVLYL